MDINYSDLFSKTLLYTFIENKKRHYFDNIFYIIIDL